MKTVFCFWTGPLFPSENRHQDKLMLITILSRTNWVANLFMILALVLGISILHLNFSIWFILYLLHTLSYVVGQLPSKKLNRLNKKQSFPPIPSVLFPFGNFKKQFYNDTSLFNYFFSKPTLLKSKKNILRKSL